MIQKSISRIVSSNPVVLPTVELNNKGHIKYVGQSGTSGYASAAKGYLAQYVFDRKLVSWIPLLFDNSKNDKNHYVDALAETTIGVTYHGYDTLIIHSTPDIWQNLLNDHGKNVDNTIGYCTWETNKLPKSWVDYINLLPEVWVPSTFNKECFINSGVISNVKVVPHIWHPQQLIDKNDITIYDHFRNVIPKNKYTFYSIGELHFKKGIEDLVKLFDKLNDDYPDTQLILKIHYKDYNVKNKLHCLDTVSKLTNKLGTSIYVITDNLTNKDILSIHSFGDCYVSLTKGEGFGLTIFDAFKHKKPVITTGYGGQLDYLTKNYSGLIDYKLDKINNVQPFNEDQEWAYPDLNHTYELMKQMI